MKKLIISLMFLSLLRADILNEFLNKNYQKVCSYKNIKSFANDDKILSIIGLSCLKIDNLYMLPYIFNRLKHTPDGRKNGIYFITIYTQKKLLYSYFFDKFPLNSFSLPQTDYILSKVFWAIKNHNYTKEGNKYVIKDNNKTLYVYKGKDNFFVVDEYSGGKLIKRHWYR